MRNKDETNVYPSYGSGPTFWKSLDPELWIVFRRSQIQKNGLILDFLENVSLNLVLITSEDETDHYASFGSGPMFWKNLHPELWIIFR